MGRMHASTQISATHKAGCDEGDVASEAASLTRQSAQGSAWLFRLHTETLPRPRSFIPHQGDMDEERKTRLKGPNRNAANA